METDEMVLTAIETERKEQRNPRGVFQKVPGKNNPWWICYWDAQGRKRREKAGTKSAAIKLYQLRKTQALEGRKLPSRKPLVLFGTLIDDGLVYSREHHVSRWQTEVGHIAGAARERFGSVAAENITPAQIEAFLSEHANAPATRNRWRSVFSLIFRLGVVNGKIPSNPIVSVRRKKENNMRERFLTAQEEARLRAAIREHFPEHEPEFDLALYTGMRASELYNLQWENVDLFRGQLTIPKSKHGEKRHVELNESAKRALARLQPKSEGPIFGWRWYRKWFSKVCRAANVANFTWHDLRHTYGSRLTADGIPLRHIMELMGHRNLNTTMRYSHLAQSDLKAAVLRLDRFAEIGQPTDTRTDTGDSSGAAPSGTIIQ